MRFYVLPKIAQMHRHHCGWTKTPTTNIGTIPKHRSRSLIHKIRQDTRKGLIVKYDTPWLEANKAMPSLNQEQRDGREENDELSKVSDKAWSKSITKKNVWTKRCKELNVTPLLEEEAAYRTGAMAVHGECYFQAAARKRWSKRMMTLRPNVHCASREREQNSNLYLWIDMKGWSLYTIKRQIKYGLWPKFGWIKLWIWFWIKLNYGVNVF